MKNWTILIYANGNNELEPEVYQRFLEFKNLENASNYNIIVQIGRANIDLVRLLRPNRELDLGTKWDGVRRYKIEDNQTLLLEDLGKVNMAAPSSFIDFVSWGMNIYHDSRIMVILSGHGAGFVGLMTDYTKEKPYMMDILGFTRGLERIKDNTNKAIDCLILDACYMNMVELWYEIASRPSKPVKYLLAPSKNIGINGLSYIDIINSIRPKLTLTSSLIETTKSINKGYMDNLLLINLKRIYFKRLKKKINKISKDIIKRDINLKELLDKWCLSKPRDPLISLIDLNQILSKDAAKGYRRKKVFESLLNRILIHPKLSSIHHRLNLGPSLYLPLNLDQYLSLRYYYYPLSFAKDNTWLEVIGEKSSRPMEIPINYVAANIMDLNPNMSHEDLIDTIDNLGWK